MTYRGNAVSVCHDRVPCLLIEPLRQ